MKPALMLMLAAFLLGLTGGAGYIFMQTTGHGKVAHSLADSLTAAAAHPDTAAVHADSSGSDPVQLAATDTPATVVVDTVAATDSSHASGPKPAGADLEPKRLAKLFGQMQPREAARVMAQMSDLEIQAILALLGDRQASAILGGLPPERAAAVSRLVMSTNERTTP